MNKFYSCFINVKPITIHLSMGCRSSCMITRVQSWIVGMYKSELNPEKQQKSKHWSFLQRNNILANQKIISNNVGVSKWFDSNIITFVNPVLLWLSHRKWMGKILIGHKCYLNEKQIEQYYMYCQILLRNDVLLHPWVIKWFWGFSSISVLTYYFSVNMPLFSTSSF